jgi:hypothetical protein
MVKNLCSRNLRFLTIPTDSEYIVKNNKMTEKLERIWKEVAVD